MSAVNLKKSTSLRLDRELYNYIEKLARKENRSVNNSCGLFICLSTGADSTSTPSAFCAELPFEVPLTDRHASRLVDRSLPWRSRS